MQLTDAQEGDIYWVRRPDGAYKARIIRLDEDDDERLVAVVDYYVVGPVDDIPEPWASCEWEKVQ